MKVELKAEIDVNETQEIQGGHKNSIGCWGGSRGSRRRRFGGPAERARNDTGGAMRQVVDKNIDLRVLCIYV